MTTVAKIKGYINGDEWGVYESAPTLKTFAEIQAYTDASALLTELNTNPSGYYNALNEDGHINDPCMGSTTEGYIYDGTEYQIAGKVYYYNGSTWEIYNKLPCAAPGPGGGGGVVD